MNHSLWSFCTYTESVYLPPIEGRGIADAVVQHPVISIAGTNVPNASLLEVGQVVSLDVEVEPLQYWWAFSYTLAFTTEGCIAVRVLNLSSIHSSLLESARNYAAELDWPPSISLCWIGPEVRARGLCRSTRSSRSVPVAAARVPTLLDVGMPGVLLVLLARRSWLTVHYEDRRHAYNTVCSSEEK